MQFKNYLNEAKKIKILYDPNIHHEARMDDYIDTLLLGKKFFSLKKGMQRVVIAHELGHWFRGKYVDFNDILGWKPEENFWILKRENSEEGFAEAFMNYLLYPNHLKKLYPDHFNRMKKYVKNKSKYLKMVSDMMKEVQELKKEVKIEKSKSKYISVEDMIKNMKIEI